MVDESKTIERAMPKATANFLDDIKYNELTCSKCYSIMWITKDECPDCGKTYPSTRENRLVRHKYIFDAYLINELRKLGYSVTISREL